MKERLQQFLAAENLTQAQFAESIDAAPAGISHILAGRNKPGYDFLLNTMKRYPSLNIEWLMTGKGKMYKTVMQHETYPPVSASQQRQEELFQNEDETEETAMALLPDDNDYLAGFSAQPPVNDENISPTTEFNTTDNTVQSPARQRKATKIIVFFDDNTFQEF